MCGNEYNVLPAGQDYIDISCKDNLRGSSVSVTLSGSNRTLSFCEIEIEATGIIFLPMYLSFHTLQNKVDHSES